MTTALRQRVETLCSAYARGNIEFVLGFVDEDVDFVSYAPVEIFPCLGKQHGKAAVAASLKAIHESFEFLTYQPILLVAEREDAAVTIMAKLKQRATGRIIHIVFAHFLRFRNGRIVEFREFMDSFDAVEQVLGRHIEIPTQ